MNTNSKYITRTEASELLRVSKVTIDTYIRKNYFKSYGIGRRVLLDQDEVLNSITQLRK